MPQMYSSNTSQIDVSDSGDHISKPYPSRLELKRSESSCSTSSGSDSGVILSEKRRARSAPKQKGSTNRSVALAYGKAVHSYLKKSEQEFDKSDFLRSHQISQEYRAKMVDWMVEVLSTFKCSSQTFFLAVSLLDRYFKNQSRLPGTELHLAGIVSMFVASKYEDVVPLLMKTIVAKIGHSKFRREVIEKKELDILKSVQYKVGAPTVLEFLDRYLFEEGLHENKKLRSICLYLAKLAMHSYDLSQTAPSVLAASVIQVALKIFEKVSSDLKGDLVLKNTLTFAQVSAEEVRANAKSLLAFAKGFDKQFPGLKNLRN